MSRRKLAWLAVGLLSLLGVGWFARQLLALYRQEKDYRALRDTGDLEARIGELARTYVNARKDSRLVVGVCRDGRRWVGGFGSGRPSAADTPDARIEYEIGSITKVFTGLLLARAEADGQCTLDDPISRWLPEDANIPTEVGAITLRQLATHTSGLPRLPDNLDATGPDDSDPYANYRAGDLLACLRETRLRNKPGARSDYSNLGMAVLGYALSRQGEKNFADLLRERILEPLEMRDTAIDLNDAQRSRLIPGHQPDGKPTPNWTFDVMAPAGALKSTAEDLLTFLDANLSGREGPIGQALRRAAEVHHGEGRSDREGLGWQIHTDVISKQSIIWHNGGTGGYRSFLAFDRANGLGLVMLSNYGDAFGDDPLDGIGFALMRVASKVSLSPAGDDSAR